MALQLIVKVVPSSGRNKWLLDKAGLLKVYLKSAPEKGKANEELIEVLAKALGVPRHGVDILAGHTARVKRVQISLDLTYEDVLQKLGIEKEDIQTTLF